MKSPRAAPEKSGIVSFVSDHHSAGELVDRLLSKRIIVNVRETAVRAAPYFYNTPDEIDIFLASLPRG